MRSIALVPVLCLSAWAADPPLEFNRDVRPILSDKCFHCHGPDAANKKIPLRLDIEAAAKADLGGRRAIVDSDAASSELVKRITSDKKHLQMPPVYSGLKLNEREINTLRTWIEQGAKWQKHWSFIPPARSEPPQVSGHVSNAIDNFVLARLEKAGIAPMPAAGRETLLRRVTLDLTGLPPTPQEIAAFLDDKSPDAYTKVVDRLLASPRYGERMAARWLDAARYADTNGYQFDGERHMWRWRDWVIDSFNRNQRFDEFITEQLAGDLLPNATLDQKIATGFNRNHRANTEDGIIPEEYAVEYVVDRVETASTVFLGLTLGCARCHNHKYDPLSQKEFYQFFAYFNQVPELGRAMKYGNSPPVVPAPTREQQRALAELNGRIAAAQKALDSREKEIARGQKAWEKQLAAGSPLNWSPVEGLEASLMFEDGPGGKATGTVTFAEGRIGKAVVLDGKSFIETTGAGGFDIDDRFSLSAWFNSEGVGDGPIVSRMSDNPKGRGFGIHLNEGRLHVHLTSVWADDAIRMEAEQTVEPGRWHHVAMTYDGSKMSEGVRVYLDGKRVEMKVHLDTLYRPFANAGKAFKEPFRVGGGWGDKRRFTGRIDDVRTYARILDTSEITALAGGESLNQLAGIPEAKRTELQRMQLRDYYLRNIAPADQRELLAALNKLKVERETMERGFPTVMVMADRPVRKETHLLLRGAYDAPGEKVEPGVPAVLHPMPQYAPPNRLGLAKWMVDPANPLTARVAVNRFWQSLFGTGLVATTEDFGQQGEWPSHPELLDWLATEFVRTGWNVKAMIKLIVSSDAYMRSSRTTPELEQRDPENRLLARGPRLRMPAEMIRDSALFAAGLLHEKLGGPSVKPYQPAGLWTELTMQDVDYRQSQGADLYRRSLYTFWKRTVAPPMMANFDSAMRESCVVRETRTNTPLQALNLMNDVTFLEAARFIGQRMLKEGGDDPASRLRYGFLLVNGRSPSPGEAQILRDNLNYHRDYFSGKPAEVKRYLSQGDSPYDSSLNPVELASYASVASLLLNLDEAVTKE